MVFHTEDFKNIYFEMFFDIKQRTFFFLSPFFLVLYFVLFLQTGKEGEEKIRLKLIPNNQKERRREGEKERERERRGKFCLDMSIWISQHLHFPFFI